MTEKTKTYCVYKITDLRTDQIVYIGKTCNFASRKSHHFTHDNRPVQKHMLDEGRENFKMAKIIDDIETNDEAIRIEDQYIVQLKPIMNKHRSGNIAKDDPVGYYKDYRKTEKYRSYHREYEKSDKRKEYKRDYDKEYRKSDKRKEYLKVYEKSDKRREYKRQYMRQYRAKMKEKEPLD